MNVQLRLAFLSAFTLASVACPAASAQIVVPLDEAVKAGKVTAEISGVGGSTGDAILIAIQRKTSESIRLTLSPGTVFKSVTGNVQNMLAAAVKGERTGETSYRPATEIVLSDNDKHTYVIEAYCLDFHKGNPGPSDLFSLESCDQGALKILQAGKAKGASIQAIQAALWMRRDGVNADQVKERFPVKDADLGAVRELLLADNNGSTVHDGARREPGRSGTTPVRTWTDATGKFTTKAKLLSVTNGVVTLEKESGTVLTVPIGRLTGADQEYLKQRTARPLLATPDNAKPKPVSVSPRETTPPEPGMPNQRAQFEQALILLGACANFSLIGKSAGSGINMEEIEVIRGDGEVMEHLKNSLLNKPLSTSLHSATTYLVGKGPKGFLQHVIIQGSETPAISAVKKVLGEEKAKEVRGDLPLRKDGSLIDMEAEPAKIVWYNYGWLRFGVLNDDVVMMIAGLGGPK